MARAVPGYSCGEPRDLLVVQVLEEEEGPQLFGCQPFGLGHWCSR